MRDEILVRRARLDAVRRARNLGQQRRLEPSAMLVRAFKVDVGDVSVLLALCAGGPNTLFTQQRPRAPRVEPDVQRV